MMKTLILLAVAAVLALLAVGAGASSSEDVIGHKNGTAEFWAGFVFALAAIALGYIAGAQ